MYRLEIEAFVLDDETTSSLQEVMGDISLYRSTLRIEQGGIDAAIEYYSIQPTTDLLIVQTRANREGLMDQLAQLSNVVGPDTSVMVVGSIDSIELYRTLKEMGVGGYIVTPFGREEFLKALRDIMGGNKADERGRVIAVYGAKGGVGASTISHNLAWSLAKIFKRPVTIVDMDLHFGCAAMDFNQEPKFGLRDALTSAEKMDQSLMEKLLSKEGENIWLLASNPSLQDIDLMSSEAMETVVDTVAKMSSFVVLDIPHIWGIVQSEVMSICDELILVTEPDLVGLRNVQSVFENLLPHRPQGTDTRAILNRVGLHKETELTSKDFAEALGSTPAASFPWEPIIYRIASSNGQMIEQVKQKTKTPALYDDLARRIAGRKEPVLNKESRKGKGLFAGLLSSGSKTKVKTK